MCETSVELNKLGRGLEHKFVVVSLVGDVSYTGQIIGVYDEDKFLWNPPSHSTVAIFSSRQPDAPLSSFRWDRLSNMFILSLHCSSTIPGDDPAIFSLSSAQMESVKLIPRPEGYVDYVDYMRRRGQVFTLVALRAGGRDGT